MYNNSSTLEKLGFNVTVGNIVWNQCKEQLTDDNSKTLLIYSSDIKNKKFMRDSAIQGIAQFRGYQCGLHGKLCEAFEIIKIVKES